MCENILCHITTRLSGQSTEDYYLKESKFWRIILRATGSVENLNSTPYVKRAKMSINELGVLLLKKTIDIKLFSNILLVELKKILIIHFLSVNV